MHMRMHTHAHARAYVHVFAHLPPAPPLTAALKVAQPHGLLQKVTHASVQALCFVARHTVCGHRDDGSRRGHPVNGRGGAQSVNDRHLCILICTRIGAKKDNRPSWIQKMGISVSLTEYVVYVRARVRTYM